VFCKECGNDMMNLDGSCPRCKKRDSKSVLLAVSRIGTLPMTDKEKELFESLWWDLRAMYQRDVAMADNGIPFATRVTGFMRDFIEVSLGD